MSNSKRRFLKIGCFLLALLTVLSAFVSCGNAELDEEENNGSLSEESEAPVPHYDWGGRSFTVLSVQNDYEPNFEIVGAYDGERLEPTVFVRNVWMEDYYNVKIEQYGDAGTKSLTLIENTIKAGANSFDLAFLLRNDMASAIMNGYMKDLNDVSYLDFSHDWYNESTLETMEIKGRLFHMVSDFSLVDKARINVLFFNRDMAERNQLPDIIQMVRDGKWTIDELLKYAKSGDLDGNGLIEVTDQWGLTAGGKEAAVAFWSGLGNKIVSFNADQEASIDIANEHSIDSIDKLNRLFASNVTLVSNKNDGWEVHYDSFTKERTLFMSSTLSTIESLGADVSFSYTALPMPKFDDTQERYYTTNDNTYCATFGIPTCAADVDFSGFMIEALSWKSSTTTFPEYYEVICKINKSYDLLCSEMLDLVFDSLVFDFGNIYGNQINVKTSVLYESIYTSKDIVGLYEGVRTATENKIENLFNGIEALD